MAKTKTKTARPRAARRRARVSSSPGSRRAKAGSPRRNGAAPKGAAKPRKPSRKPSRAGAAKASRATPESSGRGGGAASRTGMGRGGHRLAQAFEAVESLPVLAESRRRLERLTERPGASVEEMADAVESDTGLAIAVLRAASAVNGKRTPLTGVPAAVEALTPKAVESAAASVESYEFFEPVSAWQTEPERFRRHAVASRHAVERIADLGRLPATDELALAALLHDVGRLVLLQLYPGYRDLLAAAPLPEDRVQAERRELGIDHALVGGVLVRRWGVAAPIGFAIERHHAEDADEMAAAVALADHVAHHGHGEPVSADRLQALASRCGFGPERTRRLLFEFPLARGQRRRSSEPCPLSGRELDALRGLAEGKVYKEIAEELSLSASTVRTHLHNVYRKIGAVDRAQAVLIARDRDWI